MTTKLLFLTVYPLKKAVLKKVPVSLLTFSCAYNKHLTLFHKCKSNLQPQWIFKIQIKQPYTPFKCLKLQVLDRWTPSHQQFPHLASRGGGGAFRNTYIQSVLLQEVAHMF